MSIDKQPFRSYTTDEERSKEKYGRPFNVRNKEFDNLLLDVLFQACGHQKFKGNTPIGEPIIDNCCLRAYEDACDYLSAKGYLLTTNGRIYKLNPKFNSRKEVI